MSSTTTKLITAEELLSLPDDGSRYELIEGELRQMSPAGHNHGRIAMRLAAPLAQHAEENGLGEVYAAETGFTLSTNPDTVRAPGIAFVNQERVDRVGERKGYWPGAPDLAVEVVSPNDKVSEIKGKVKEWLEAGALSVWLISPEKHTVTVYRSLTEIFILTEKDTLDGGEIIPGFKYPVAKLFAIKRR